MLDVLHSQDFFGYQLLDAAQPWPLGATVEVSPPPYTTKSIRLHRLHLPANMDERHESIASSQIRQDQMTVSDVSHLLNRSFDPMPHTKRYST